MQYGFKAHAIKHEPIALQLLERTIALGFVNIVTAGRIETPLGKNFTRLQIFSL